MTNDLSRESLEKIAEASLERGAELVAEEFKRLLKRVRMDLKASAKLRHRRLLVICGGSPEKQGTLAAYTLRSLALTRKRAGSQSFSVLYIYHDEFEPSKLRKEVFKLYMKRFASKRELGVERTIDVYEKTDRYLGMTFDALVLDLNDDLRPNDVGRLVEVVRGGGVVVFLAPPWSSWDVALTLFKQRLLVPGFAEPRHIFITRFKRKLMEHDGIYIYDAEKDEIIKRPRVRRPKLSATETQAAGQVTRPKGRAFPSVLYDMALTSDQAEAIEALESLVPRPKKGRKSVVVITSDRGRGKSCAVGIGLVGLAEALRRYKHRVRIIVTAPSPTNVQSLFSLACAAARTLGHEVRTIEKEGTVIELKGPFYSIEYWEPLAASRVRGDVLATDEASGIHVPMLLRLYESYDRLIFTATIHGYEGAGRGFSVRFLGALKNDPRADLRMCELEEPIRYGPGDPVEAWLYDTLLLSAEPAELDEDDMRAIERGDLRYVELEPADLFSERGEETLKQLFGIYVLAHYRNEPDDLGMLADAPHHLIRAVVLPSGKVVCSLQVAVEGGLEEELIEVLLRGSKIPGNIIPDRLLKHLRFREAGRMKGYRIVRIATHPAVQGRGIGSFAISMLLEEAKRLGMDWIGSGFGVNAQLLSFWLKNGFVPLHMSPDRNPVSGEYTLIVLKPVSSAAELLVRVGKGCFLRKLLKSLRDVYRELETEVALMLIKTLEGDEERDLLPLDEINAERLWIYAHGPMTYEASSDVMLDVAMHYFTHYGKTKVSLSKEEELVLLAKVLQCKGWEEVARELKQDETKVMYKLKDVARKFVEAYLGRGPDSEVGLSLEREA
ncbi:MAG: GNAT family N-acetyltransferase [Fervidicoccaceae archaeon]